MFVTGCGAWVSTGLPSASSSEHFGQACSILQQCLSFWGRSLKSWSHFERDWGESALVKSVAFCSCVPLERPGIQNSSWWLQDEQGTWSISNGLWQEEFGCGRADLKCSWWALLNADLTGASSSSRGCSRAWIFKWCICCLLPRKKKKNKKLTLSSFRLLGLLVACSDLKLRVVKYLKKKKIKK